MYNIAIIGHESGNLRMDEGVLKAKIKNTINLLYNQYGKDLLICCGGDPGAEQITLDLCNELKIKYHLFIPCPIDLIGNNWFEEQKQKLLYHYKYCYANSIISDKLTKKSYIARNNKIIDYSNFVIAFWNGCKQGSVFDTIKYSIKTNKLILNGLDELKLISNYNLNKKG